MSKWFGARFERDDDNVEHLIAGHNIYPEAAEQVFANDPQVRRRRRVAYA